MDATAPPTTYSNTGAVDNTWQAPPSDLPPSWQTPPNNSPPYYPVDKPHDNQGAVPAYAPYPQGAPQHIIQTSQQQTGVFVISNTQQQPPTTFVIASPPRPSYAAHHVLACFVLWCCNPLFGLIAFVLAVLASGSPDADGARRLGKASIIVSIVGVVVAVVIIAIIVGVSVSRANSTSCNYSYRYGYGYGYVCGR